MKKTQVYLKKEEIAQLRMLAKRGRKSMTNLVREALRHTWLRGPLQGPVALWTKPISKNSIDHDSIYDEP